MKKDTKELVIRALEIINSIFSYDTLSIFIVLLSTVGLFFIFWCLFSYSGILEAILLSIGFFIIYLVFVANIIRELLYNWLHRYG